MAWFLSISTLSFSFLLALARSTEQEDGRTSDRPAGRLSANPFRESLPLYCIARSPAHPSPLAVVEIHRLYS